MARQHSMKSGGGTGSNGTLNSRVERTSVKPQTDGAYEGNLGLKGPHGIGEGTQYSRVSSTKPAGGTSAIGQAQPLETNKPATYDHHLKGPGTYSSTKPKR